MNTEWTDEHIGSRVIYTGRNGNQRLGSLRGFTNVGNSIMLDLKLDGSAREHFFVPSDTVTLVPDGVEDKLKDA